MTKLEALRDKLAKECRDAYFNAEEYYGRSVQSVDDSFRSGFDACLATVVKDLVYALKEGDQYNRTDVLKKWGLE